MRNMLIRPSPEELQDFHHPDFTIFNAGEFPAVSRFAVFLIMTP
jgi:phosphoenolpyruvate carboxykinase (ATP)